MRYSTYEYSLLNFTQDQRQISIITKICVLFHVFFLNSYRNLLAITAKLLLLLVLLVPFALLILSSAIQTLTATSVLPLTPSTYLPSSNVTSNNTFKPLSLLTYLDALDALGVYTLFFINLLYNRVAFCCLMCSECVQE